MNCANLSISFSIKFHALWWVGVVDVMSSLEVEGTCYMCKELCPSVWRRVSCVEGWWCRGRV